ncbi:MAG: hypothetical protein NC393_04125 [Clostridium sp.]|nr:hypothetical protein [Clostridium sp.]MCM1208964.1 hypothetical protein [Ruminococcus sp.]
MSGVTCKLCGGDMEEIIGGDGMQCDTCGFIIRSDSSEDYSEVEDEEPQKAYGSNTGRTLLQELGDAFAEAIESPDDYEDSIALYESHVERMNNTEPMLLF